jgi:hypothetical protein
LDILTASLWAIAFVAAAFGAGYYVQLRRVKREYEKAKGVVDDVVFSFNRQLKQEARRVEGVAYKVEATSSRIDNAVSGVDELRKKVDRIEQTLLPDSEDEETLSVRLADLEKRAGEIAASNESLLSRMVALETQVRQPRIVPDTSLEGVIPIRREKAFAQLTDTEVSVLELLASEGARTAPEIKELVKLSREHTARLMKKLYEEGYLERETGKIPFRYTVKKEMEKFLKKAESEPS